MTYCTTSELPFCCGVAEFGRFKSYNNGWGDSTIHKSTLDGSAFGIANLIDTPECKSAYNQIKKKYKIIYQSPVRQNRAGQIHNNPLFMIVFTIKKK